ncbi:MAG: hypothetical protein U0841_05610 [Chloroflexia bacterium]
MRRLIAITIATILLTSCATRAGTPTRPPDRPTTPAIPTLKPPDSDLSAAGICGTATSTVALVTINPDTPSPRCQHITPNQSLRIINHTDHPADIRLADHALTLPPQTEGSINQPFGDYLAPGVHVLEISTYPGGGAALWLDR